MTIRYIDRRHGILTPGIPLKYHAMLLSVTARYNGKITHTEVELTVVGLKGNQTSTCSRIKTAHDKI